MTPLLPERVTVTSEDLSAEVYRCASWPIQRRAVQLWTTFASATGDVELAALHAFYEFFVAEAQPTWDWIDHRGAIPATLGGLLRVNRIQACGLVHEWISTLQEVAPPTAVDELLPDSPLRDELNRQLRSVKAA